MAQPVQHSVLTTSIKTGSDMYTLKRFVKVGSGVLAYCGAGELAVGVLQAETNEGKEAPVLVQGIAVVEVGSGGIVENTEVMSDANGKAVTWAHPVAGGTYSASEVNALFDKKSIGIALDTASAGELVRVLLK
jgi:hypothetical protein